MKCSFLSFFVFWLFILCARIRYSLFVFIYLFVENIFLFHYSILQWQYAISGVFLVLLTHTQNDSKTLEIDFGMCLRRNYCISFQWSTFIIVIGIIFLFDVSYIFDLYNDFINIVPNFMEHWRNYLKNNLCE